MFSSQKKKKDTGKHVKPRVVKIGDNLLTF
jgi:hypothetical protein